MMYATLWKNEVDGGCKVFNLDKHGNPSPYDVDVKVHKVRSTRWYSPEGVQGAAPV